MNNRLAQVRRCIEDWNLMQLPAVEPFVPSPSPTLSDDWELVSTPSGPEAIPRYTPSDPALIFEYNKKPLPSIPIPKTRQNSTKIQKRRPSSTTDRLKQTCHHGPDPSDTHEVQTRLKDIRDGTPPIDRFTEDKQTYERIALGLDKGYDEDEDMASIVFQPWRRAGDPANPNSNRRQLIGVRLADRKPRNDKKDRHDGPPGSESSGKRKRGPTRNDEDDEERKDRKKSPPSPPDEE
jgi:hypothetical protein